VSVAFAVVKPIFRGRKAESKKPLALVSQRVAGRRGTIVDKVVGTPEPSALPTALHPAVFITAQAIIRNFQPNVKVIFKKSIA
jgi:hypothetical protein